jgi:APA family basic amino acid/polyamine antiporter
MNGRLRRILGVGFGLAVILGSTLGVGILRTPGLVAGQLGTPVAILSVWLIGGLYTLLCSICFTELGTALPQAGGYYVYARRAFGDTIGFAVGWSDWLTYCSVLGYLSIAMAEFAGLLLPSLAAAVRPIAIGLLVAFVGLQWLGLRASSRFQEWTTAIKFVAFLALVAACLALASRATAAPAGPAPAATIAGVVIALQSVVITYGGWQSALYFTEEDADPVRNLPRAMIGGEALVIVVYLLVNVALLAVLPVAAIAHSTLAASDAAQAVLGGRGAVVVTVLSLVSLPPTVNAIMMIGTRILFAMGRDGLLWRRAADVNAAGTPTTAMLVTTAVAVALIATGTFQRLVALTSFFLVLDYGICCVGLIALRRREPALPRPFRAWGYPWTVWIVLLGAAGFLIGMLVGDTMNGAAALGLIVAGVVGRRLIPMRQPRPIAAE